MAQPDRPGPEDGRPRHRTFILTAVGCVVAAVLLMAIISRVITLGTSSSGGGVTLREAGTFDVGPAAQRAKAVERDGPLLFPDPQGRSRDIYLQHLGGQDWVAFVARPDGAPRRCTLTWRASDRTFVDPCDGRIFPADGTGLTTFPATVTDKGRLVVDLSRPSPPN